ncbi:kinase-like protein [Lentinus brumalis]|uniref:Kinase-like protein n=1 Tax=Lentinus brumalis TaxID=2498619 RepID=A0A371DEY8_9APHY|nr:kinase-like protein [Polyporus brumalis]
MYYKTNPFSCIPDTISTSTTTMASSKSTLADIAVINEDNSIGRLKSVPRCYFEEYEVLQEQLSLYRQGYLHPVAVTDIIRPDVSISASRAQHAPSGYRILHKLGSGGEATVWLAQELDHLDRAVSLKIFSGHCSSAGEREARALKACVASPNTPGSRHILSLLDDFNISGPNGTHKVHVTEVVMPLMVLSRLLSPTSKTEVARDLARGLAHVHHCGFVHGDIHDGNVGCAMPPAFAREKIADMMSLLSSYDVTMVIPNNPAFHGPELPHYLLSACELLLVYESYNGLKAHQHAKLYDFGNARRAGEETNGTDDVRWAWPPPEAAFAYHGCNKREALPTMAGDIWCLGALILRLFTGEWILHDTSPACLLEQAKLDGVIPAAWREYWDTVAYLRDRSDQVTHENADVGWSKRRDYFMQKNPNVDVAEVELLISLLRRMLATEPEMRLSADEVLTYPWFAEGFGAPPDGPSPEPCEHNASVKR